MMRPRRRLSALPFNRLIPNIMTVTALCAGLTAILYGVQSKWQFAVAAIMIAALLDALDGRIARLLGGTSRFGAELDSLSDFVCFGVAPALLLFLWTLQDAKGPGWVIALVFSVCAALRLARFNTRLGDSDMPVWAGNFFTGVPAPAGGGLVLLPMMLSFEFDLDFLSHPLINGPVAVIVAYMMISRIPTFSFKKVRVPQRLIVPLLLMVGLLAALLATATWLTISSLLILYLCSIPVSVRAYRSHAATTDTATDTLAVIDGAVGGDEDEDDDETDAPLSEESGEGTPASRQRPRTFSG
jgi:CDP-diacylglycerol--serine O-phosphatidyltransferase